MSDTKSYTNRLSMPENPLGVQDLLTAGLKYKIVHVRSFTQKAKFVGGFEVGAKKDSILTNTYYRKIDNKVRGRVNVVKMAQKIDPSLVFELDACGGETHIIVVDPRNSQQEYLFSSKCCDTDQYSKKHGIAWALHHKRGIIDEVIAAAKAMPIDV